MGQERCQYLPLRWDLVDPRASWSWEPALPILKGLAAVGRILGRLALSPCAARDDHRSVNRRKKDPTSYFGYRLNQGLKPSTYQSREGLRPRLRRSRLLNRHR